MDKTTISIVLELIIAIMLFSGVASGFYAWAIGDLIAEIYATCGLLLWWVTLVYYYIQEKESKNE